MSQSPVITADGSGSTAASSLWSTLGVAIVVLISAWLILRRYVIARFNEFGSVKKTWAEERGETAEMVSGSGL